MEEFSGVAFHLCRVSGMMEDALSCANRVRTLWLFVIFDTAGEVRFTRNLGAACTCKRGLPAG
jgi:hypothetical protein